MRHCTKDVYKRQYVDHIIYRNADNGYTVLVLVCNEEEADRIGIQVLQRSGFDPQAITPAPRNALYSASLNVFAIPRHSPVDFISGPRDVYKRQEQSLLNLSPGCFHIKHDRKPLPWRFDTMLQSLQCAHIPDRSLWLLLSLIHI